MAEKSVYSHRVEKPVRTQAESNGPSADMLVEIIGVRRC